MPQILILALAVVAAVLCVEAPPRWAVTLVLAVTFLVPDTVQVPYAPHWLTVFRLVVWAATLGVVLRVSRGEMPGDSLRPGRVHAALALLVVFAYVVGVDGAVAPATFSPDFNRWLAFIDQLLLLTTVVALARVVGVRWIATRFVVIVGIVAAIGVWERFGGGTSYARFWFEHGKVLINRFVPAQRLERRGGAARVRASSEFALEFGWILVIAVPVAIAIAFRARRLIAWLLPLLLMVGAILSISRSVFIGLVAGVLMMLIVSRFDRRLVRLCLVAAGIGAVLYFGPGGLRAPYHGAPANSIDSRKHRLLFVGDAVLAHPYTGLGFDGLDARGLASTDDSYLLTYASIGALGLVLLGAALVVPVAVGAVGAIRDDDADDRLLTAGVVGALVAALWSAASYDAFELSEATAELWILAALAVVAADRVRQRRAAAGAAAGEILERDRPTVARLALPILGVMFGLIVGAVSSGSGAASVNAVGTLTPRQLLRGDQSFAGQILANTVCVAGEHEVQAFALHAQISCSANLSNIGAVLGSGTVTLRIAAANSVTLDRALQDFDAGASAVDVGYSRSETRRTVGQPTPIRTAPVWAGLVGLLLAIFLPTRQRSLVPLDEEPVGGVGGEPGLEDPPSGDPAVAPGEFVGSSRP